MGTKAHRALEAKADGVRNGVKVQEKRGDMLTWILV